MCHRLIVTCHAGRQGTGGLCRQFGGSYPAAFAGRDPAYLRLPAGIAGMSLPPINLHFEAHLECNSALHRVNTTSCAILL